MESGKGKGEEGGEFRGAEHEEKEEIKHDYYYDDNNNTQKIKKNLRCSNVTIIW